MIDDLRCSLRALARRPGFALSVCCILGIGIGFPTALFCIAEAFLLAPPPYPESERLVQLWETNVELRDARHGPAPGNIHDWRSARSLEKISAWWLWKWRTLPRDGARGAEQLRSAMVTADFFSVLGVKPVLGRTFSAREVAREEKVLVLSFELWQRRFGASADVVGRSLRSKDGVWRIVGVMPVEFRVPGLAPGDIQLFEPWDFEHRYRALPSLPRDWRFARAAARLAAGVTLAEARAELNAIAGRLAEVHPDTNHGWGVEITALNEPSPDNTTALLVLFGGSLFVLLLACASAGSLLLVRALGRRREMAVRMALGARRPRWIGGLLFESTFLTIAGGALSLLVSRLSIAAFLGLGPEVPGHIDQTTLAGQDVAIAALATLVIAVLTGIAHSVPGSLGATCLSGEGTRLSGGDPVLRFTKSILITQIAISLMLLIGSGLLLRSFNRIVEVDPGFDADDLLVVRMRLDGEYMGRADDYFLDLIEKLKSLPGVVDAGGITALPMDRLDVDFDRPYWREGEPRPAGGGRGVKVRVATVGYFETMRIPLLAGRSIRMDDDGTKPRVLIVNETMARRTWPGEEALGKRLRLHYQGYTKPYEIVGVVGDTRPYGRRSASEPTVYVPHQQSPYLLLNVVVRCETPAAGLVPAVRRAVLEIDPDQPAHSIETMGVLMAEWERWDRVAAILMSAFGGFGLLIASVGTYTLVAYSLGRRRHEIGVRMAFGAARDDILRLVLSRGCFITLGGVVIGLAGTFFLTQFMERLLFEVSATDPWTLATAAFVLASVVLVATYCSVRRETDVAPTVLMRRE